MLQGPRAPFPGGMPYHRGMPSQQFMNPMPHRSPIGPMMRVGGPPQIRVGGPPQMRVEGPPQMRVGAPPQMRVGGPPQMRGGGPSQMRGGGPPSMRQGGGGLLARILGRGNQAGIAGGNTPAASRAAATSGGGGGGAGGILKTLSNPTAINGFLTNTQKVFSTAQQFGPMVQQYGPMVKNIPAMWKLYRGMKNPSDESIDEEVKETEDLPSSVKRKAKAKRKNTQIQIEQPAAQSIRRNETGASIPKLYI